MKLCLTGAQICSLSPHVQETWTRTRLCGESIFLIQGASARNLRAILILRPDQTIWPVVGLAFRRLEGGDGQGRFTKRPK